MTLCIFSLNYIVLARRYSCADLLNIHRVSHQLPAEIFIPPEIGSSLGQTPLTGGRRRRRCKRKQKRGKRASVRARPKANPSKPPLLSIFLANICSIQNKIDEIRLQLTSKRTLVDCCCMIFSEMWLNNSIPEEAIELAGCTTYRADQTKDSGKKNRGVLCVYINNCWCSDIVITERHCCPI